MKLAILSDVHGNLPALRAVLDCVNEITPDGVIVAGDLVGGPDFIETTSLLDNIGALMILGNMDLDFLKFLDGDFPLEKRASRQWGFMRWHAENADSMTINFLRELPVQREVVLGNNPPILVAHGSPRSPYESLFPDKESELLKQVVKVMTQSVLVCGHIHIQWYRRVAGKLVLNPGSISSPLQGDRLSRFSILKYENEDWAVEHKAVEYDVGELRRRYHESGLFDAGGAISRVMLMSCETGRDVARPFYNFALHKANKTSLGPDEYIPDDLWRKAEDEFPWSEFI